MVNLIYSDLKESHISFADILRHSICANEVQLNTYCESCQRFSTAVESRRMLALPDILVINCGLESNAALDIWLRKGGGIRSDGQGLSATASARAGQGDNPNIQFINKRCRFGDKCNRRSCRFLHSDTSDPYTAARGEREGIGSGQSWLPFTLNIIVRGDGTSPTVRETEINNGDGINYELAAIVCVIHHDSRENIVSLINVGAGYHERHHSSGMSHWYVFNDFTVHSIKESEVGHLPVDWKQPCMLYYIRKDIAHKYKDLKVISPLTEDLIRKDTSIPRNASARLKTFTPLLDSEQFSAGDIVAMDAEFVTLNQEEAEIRSDGTRATIRPSQRSVARISCLRGQGQMEGVAFIDDYIATQEQVVDYLTQFSGIQPGDLDVTVSSKHLSTLKATYQKLRLLVDKGVIFVGHGLKNDFRVINLVVPQEQVRDTVLLFQLRNKRMLSLRFLAWHFFGETIQSETHDSIEDAKTALRLYRKYLELEQRDEINAALTELYEVGKKYNWKVPKDGAGGGYSNAGTPAAPLE
ncbi:PAN2-PAN3 deadenylation complex catalytic subunit PAN2-like [Varroa destructor]|uniref:Exonuclease domain-containing protein n=2 Tax=Varroa TaxID=62624 RepID=A0A7M7J675_VARDE|nr:PAN2-PAN3 deadenylation complex catalytic subunit PAN2-like [Varroa destructor]